MSRSTDHRETITTVLTDVVAPVVIYYGLRAAGADPWSALLLGAVLPAGRAIFVLIRHRRVEWLAILVLAVIVVSAGTSLLSGSPRFLLAKDGAITAVLGLLVLATTSSRQPAMFSLGRMMVSQAGHDPGSWNRRWEDSARFRHIWRVLTLVWGVGLLVDAALRVVLAYTLPIDVVPALTTVQWLVLLVILQIISQVYLRRPGNRELVFD